MSTLAEQNPQRKHRKRKGAAAPKRHSWQKVVTLGLALPRALFKFSFKFAKNHPRIAATIGVSLIAVGGVYRLTSALYDQQEQALPTQIVIDTSSDALKARIYKTTHELLTAARAKGMHRSSFVTELTHRLESIDALDDYRVRAGFDQKLQIFASPQRPVLILDTANGARLVVSHRMKIMARANGDESFPGVPVLSLPEYKMAGKGKNDFFTRKSSLPGLNLPWLYRQTQLITASLSRTGFKPLVLQGSQWRPSTGFSLKLILPTMVSAPTAATTPAGSSGPATESNATAATTQEVGTQVVIGNHDISQKLARLEQVLKDFQSRGLVPENIDMDFQDKAIVRLNVSEANTHTTLTF